MAIGEIATGLVSSILYDGLGASIRTVRGDINRRGVIRKSLHGESVEDQWLAHRSIQDLVRVLGGAEGKYDVPTAAFIRDLRRTAVPESMLQLLMVGRSADEAFPAFELVYRSHAPLGFTAVDLFRALAAAIRARIEDASNDPMLLEVVRAHGVDVRKQLSQLRAFLARAGNVTEPLDAAEFREARIRVARSVEIANKELPVETLRGPRRIPIARLVIPARLRSTDNRNPDTPTARSTDENTIGLIDFRRSVSTAIIMGDPGGGKSTSTQLLCHDMAKQIILEGNNPAVEAFQPKDLRLPLRIIVRDLDARQLKDPAYSVLDYLTDEIRASLDNDIALSSRLLIQSLSVGDSFVIFDGLDEVLDVARRRAMASQIDQFSTIYMGCPTLVTSRVVGYRDAPLPDRFKAHVLSRFNREEVTEYATKLIRAIKGMKVRQAKELAESFLSQTEKLASDLRENPLMLGLMVYIFSEKGAVPDNRPEIYRQCSVLMFERWDAHRGIDAGIDDDFTLMDLFGHVAVKVFGDPDAEQGVTKDWLTNEVRVFFEDWYGSRPRATKAANQLVRFITGRAWVMCDVGPDQYKFTHRTFMEYFVARHVNATSETAAELIEYLYPRIIAGEWDVVSHLALQLAAENGAKAVRIADTLSDLAEQKLPDQHLLNLLTFLSRAIEYLNIPEPKTRELARRVVDRAGDLSNDSFSSAAFLFAALNYHGGKRRDMIAKMTADYAKGSIVSLSTEGSFARYLLAKTSVYTKDIGSSVNNAYAYEYAVALRSALAGIRENERERIAALAKQDVGVAADYWYVYGDRFGEIYDTHGQTLLLRTGSHENADDQFPLIFVLLGSALQSIVLRRQPGRTEEVFDGITRIAGDICRDGLNVEVPYLRSKELIEGSRGYLEHIGEMLIRNLSFLRHSRVKSGDLDKFGSACVVFFALIELQEHHLKQSSARGPKPRPRLKMLEAFLPIKSPNAILQTLGESKQAGAISTWLLGEKSFLAH